MIFNSQKVALFLLERLFIHLGCRLLVLTQLQRWLSLLLGRNTKVHEILLRSSLTRLLSPKVKLIKRRCVGSRGAVKIEIWLFLNSILRLSLLCLRISQIIQSGHILVHRNVLLFPILPLHFFPHLLLHNGDVIAGYITLLRYSETLISSWLRGSLNVLRLKRFC